MSTLLRLVIAVPLGLLLVALAVVNNQPVTVSFDPLGVANPPLAVTLPLYGVFFAALVLGVVIGGLALWFGQHRQRRIARERAREAERLRAEAERLRGAVSESRGLRVVGDSRAA